MILIRYLVKETLKSQLTIFFVLLLIFFSQNSINILEDAAKGGIPSDLILPLLAIGIPHLMPLILPLSLFLGILMTYSKLYIDSEMTVMHACRLGKLALIKAALILSIITSVLAIVNIACILPWSSQYKEQLQENVKANPKLATILEGRFTSIKGSNTVLYIEKAKDNHLKNIFISQPPSINHSRPFIVTAENGYFKEIEGGHKVILLDEGTHYEIASLLRDFRITDFKNYQGVVEHRDISLNSNNIEQMTLLELWKMNETKSKTELYWRLTLVFSIVLMALIAVPLSEVNPRQGRILSLLPAMLLYLTFFLLQGALRHSAEKGNIEPIYALGCVNFSYLLLALLLNVWDSLPIRHLRERFSRYFV